METRGRLMWYLLSYTSCHWMMDYTLFWAKAPYCKHSYNTTIILQHVTRQWLCDATDKVVHAPSSDITA